MTEYSGSSAPGSMRPGDGRTTVVGLNNRLSGKDKEVLCGAMCPCSRIGVATRGGARIMRQKCVEQRLNAMNESSIREYGAPTEYLPEVKYDMSPKPPEPPVPIMSDENPLVPHDSLVDWIIDNWPGGMKGYRAGKRAGLDQTRRPDIVIVRDPTQPPVQSNIKNVVEMKFDDAPSKGQLEAYIRIAGSKSKVITLRPADCGCGDKEQEQRGAESTQSQSETDELFGGNSGGVRRAGPFGVPPLPPVTPGIAIP